MKLSRSRLSELAALKQKKGREESGLFFVEGEKILGEVFSSRFSVALLAASEMWLQKNGGRLGGVEEVFTVTTGEMERLSALKTPTDVWAVLKRPSPEVGVSQPPAPEALSLVLDGIQDPGNLGTILRLADWFGIETLYCSPDTADWTNPKVIQATMGAFLRVDCRVVHLPEFLDSFPSRPEFPVYGTYLEGQSLYDAALSPAGLIILGNEGSGISDEVSTRVTSRLTIPPFGNRRAESLNVATAAAIVCSEFRRRWK